MSQTRAKKPDATSRTVDMFTGKTQAEVVSEAQRIAADEDLVQEADRAEAKPMEEEVDRWRGATFRTQEWLSAAFPIDHSGPGTQFRISYAKVNGQGWYYLEEVHTHTGKHATSYKGVMWREEDLFALTEVVVAAARAKKAREK